jgi:hypothetical protein
MPRKSSTPRKPPTRGASPTPRRARRSAGFAMPTPAKDAVIAACYRAAERKGVPVQALLALAHAESTFVNWERWHTWTGEAVEALKRNDRQTLRDIVERGRAKNTRDYSFGPFHQTFGWRGRDVLPEFTDPWDLDGILKFREMLFDVDFAADLAADFIRPFIATFGLTTEALSRYNKMDGSASAEVRARYTEGLAVAARIVAESRPTQPAVGSDQVPMERALVALWQAVAPIPWTPTLGITKYWMDKENRKRLGSPITEEFVDPTDGKPCQAFSSGIIVRWDPEGPVEV